MRHPFEPVRLVAAGVLTRQAARWVLPELIESLNDEFFLDRQFAQKGLEDMLDIRLDDFGHRFYMMRAERGGPLDSICRAILDTAGRRHAARTEEQ